MFWNDTIVEMYWKFNVVLRNRRWCFWKDILDCVLESLDKERVISNDDWGDLWMAFHDVKEIQIYNEREVVFLSLLIVELI